MALSSYKYNVALCKTVRDLLVGKKASKKSKYSHKSCKRVHDEYESETAGTETQCVLLITLYIVFSVHILAGSANTRDKFLETVGVLRGDNIFQTRMFSYGRHTPNSAGRIFMFKMITHRIQTGNFRKKTNKIVIITE